MEDNYYPPTDSQYPDWLENYTNKVAAFVTAIGISSTEETKLKLIRDALVFTSGRASTYDDARLEFVRTRQIILNGDETNALLEEVAFEPQPAVVAAPSPAPPNVKPFIQNLVLRTRNCPTLNELQKKELGVLPKPRPVPEVQAILKGQVVNGLPVLEARLYGLPAFDLWRSLTGQNDFAFLNRIIGNTYTDDSPLPQGLTAVQYDYKMRLIGTDNEPASDFSNVVTLTKTA